MGAQNAFYAHLDQADPSPETNPGAKLLPPPRPTTVAAAFWDASWCGRGMHKCFYVTMRH
jgi:hypothetical protein